VRNVLVAGGVGLLIALAGYRVSLAPSCRLSKEYSLIDCACFLYEDTEPDNPIKGTSGKGHEGTTFCCYEHARPFILACLGKDRRSELARPRINK
jgi:hypothetical protein